MESPRETQLRLLTHLDRPLTLAEHRAEVTEIVRAKLRMILAKIEGRYASDKDQNIVDRLCHWLATLQTPEVTP